MPHGHEQLNSYTGTKTSLRELRSPLKRLQQLSGTTEKPLRIIAPKRKEEQLHISRSVLSPRLAQLRAALMFHPETAKAERYRLLGTGKKSRAISISYIIEIAVVSSDLFYRRPQKLSLLKKPRDCTAVTDFPCRFHQSLPQKYLH